MQTAPQGRLTHEEYFALEEKTGQKYEYFQGEVFAMAGPSPEHAALQSNTTIAVGIRLRGRPCRTFSTDLRVYIESLDLYTYPELSIVCGSARYSDARALLNPTVLVEVLSPSTEAYDRGEKFAMYQQIESLRQYVLVTADKHRVEVYTRRSEGTWTYEALNGLEASVRLDAIDCQVPLGELYEGIEILPHPLHPTQ